MRQLEEQEWSRQKMEREEIEEKWKQLDLDRAALQNVPTPSKTIISSV